MGSIDDLADRYVEDLARLDPCAATAMGIGGHDSELTDYSPDGFAARGELTRSLLADLASVTIGTDREHVAAEVLSERLGIEVELYEAGLRLGELNVVDGPLQQLRRAFDPMVTVEDVAWEPVMRRLSAIPASLGGLRQSLLVSAWDGQVVSLPERRRSAELPPDCRPAPPSVEAYDQLLRTTPRKGNAS